LLLPAAPARAAELTQLRLRLAAADVLLHQVDPRRRDVQEHAVAELEDQVLFGRRTRSAELGTINLRFRFFFAPRSELRAPRFFEHPHPAEPGDPVRDVDDVIPLVEVEERVDRPGLDLPRAAEGRAFP